MAVEEIANYITLVGQTIAAMVCFAFVIQAGIMYLTHLARSPLPLQVGDESLSLYLYFGILCAKIVSVVLHWKG